VPYLSNINEDPMLTGKILKDFHKTDKLTVGRQTDQFTPDIQLGGAGIKDHHAELTKDENGDIWIEAVDEDACDLLLLNGENVSGKTQLFH
jgi:hypothetical protein